MTSRCSDARDRTRKRSEWSSERTRDVTMLRLLENARNLNRLNTYGLFGSKSFHPEQAKAEAVHATTVSSLRMWTVERQPRYSLESSAYKKRSPT